MAAPAHAAMLLRSADDAAHFLQAYDNFILDCDGVIFQGGISLPGAEAALTMLLKMGKVWMGCLQVLMILGVEMYLGVSFPKWNSCSDSRLGLSRKSHTNPHHFHRARSNWCS